MTHRPHEEGSMLNWIRSLVELLERAANLDDGHGLPPPPR